MDSFTNSEITLADVALMQHLLSCLWSSSVTEAVPFSYAASLSFIPPLSHPLPSQLVTQSSANVPITGPYLSSSISQALPASDDYHYTTSSHLSHPSSIISQTLTPSHDICHATSAHLGHPTSLAAWAISLSQPFLGFNELSVEMTGQANQRHLASAAAHLPGLPCLVTRGSQSNQGVCHGPAAHPPSLPCGPALKDCMYVEPNINVPMVCTKVYIYPPKPHRHSRVSYTPWCIFISNWSII